MSNEIVLIDVKSIKPPFFEARTTEENEFSQEMSDMIESAKAHGIIEPIVVRPKDGGFELVIGHRRLKAAKYALLGKVPAIVKEMSDSEALIAMLVENIHRKDLSDVEKGRLLTTLYELFKESYPTQEELARLVGKRQEWVSRMMRAYETAQQLQSDKATKRIIKRSGIEVDELTEKQLRVIAQVDNPKERRSVLRQVMKEQKRASEPIKVKPAFSARRIEAKLKEERIKTDFKTAVSHVHLNVLGENFDRIRNGLSEFLKNYPQGEESVWRRLAGEFVLTLNSIPYEAAELVLKEVEVKWKRKILP